MDHVKLSCATQHRTCVHYGSDTKPIVEILQSADHFDREINNTFIMYVLHGEVRLSYGTVLDYTLKENDLMLFPPGIRVTGGTSEKAKVMVLRIMDYISLCDQYTFESLYQERNLSQLRHTHLTGTAMVRMQMELLAEIIDQGLLCVRFMTAKVHELFFYLRAYYSDDELAGFNLPLLSADAQFMDFIWQNYRKVHTVEQFARMNNSSLAAFKVKFKRITGMPPSQWLEKQKVRNVYHEICCGQKSLKEVSQQFHFSSASHLGTFCQKHFGKSPGHLKSNRNRTEE
jgi:AraC-like DNA-binding protein